MTKNQISAEANLAGETSGPQYSSRYANFVLGMLIVMTILAKVLVGLLG